MRAWPTILCLGIGFLVFGASVGCTSRAGKTHRDDIQACVDAFEAAAPERGWDESDPNRSAPVVARVRHAIKEIRGPERLPLVLHAWRESYERLCQQVPDDKSDRLMIIDSVVTSELVGSLADYRTATAARILVELMCDESLGWDGEYGLVMHEEVLRMGHMCIPFLEAVPDDNRRRGYALALIEELRASVPVPTENPCAYRKPHPGRREW